MTATTSDLIVERLLEWGVEHCFGIVGDQVNPFVEAMRIRSDRFRFVQTRHEEAAVFAAVGYAKFTGRPAAVLATDEVVECHAQDRRSRRESQAGGGGGDDDERGGKKRRGRVFGMLRRMGILKFGRRRKDKVWPNGPE